MGRGGGRRVVRRGEAGVKSSEEVARKDRGGATKQSCGKKKGKEAKEKL